MSQVSAAGAVLLSREAAIRAAQEWHGRFPEHPSRAVVLRMCRECYELQKIAHAEGFCTFEQLEAVRVSLEKLEAVPVASSGVSNR